MNGTMLEDEGTGINRYEVVLGEDTSESAAGAIIKSGITVNRIDYGIVQNKEVGVGGRQTVAFVVKAYRSHRQGYEIVGIAFCIAKFAKFLFHQGEIMKVLIVGIVAFDVGNRLARTKAGERVNMTVSVIARKMSVSKPKHTFRTKEPAQSVFDVFAGAVLAPCAGA